MSSNTMPPQIGLVKEREPTSIGGRLAVAPALAAVIMLMPASTSTATAASGTKVVVTGIPTGNGGFTAGNHLAYETTKTLATAGAVRELRARSGLTWDELARAFGVSRRTVHAWANGTRLNQAHATRLSTTAELIDGLPQGNPERARAALHAPGPGGISPYQRLIRSFAQPGNRREGFEPWELLAREETDRSVQPSDQL